MVKFKNCWLGIFLTLLCILAASYLSGVRSDLHQVPCLGLPHYSSVQLEIICWHTCHPHQSWSKPHSHSPWHRVGSSACLVNRCWSNKRRDQPWWFMGPRRPHLLPLACPLEACCDVSQVVQWWEFDKGLYGGREQGKRLNHIQKHLCL